jgi:aquaporin Z
MADIGIAPTLQQQSDRTASAARRGPVWHIKHHWPEYCMEAAELGLFMISACIFGVLLFYPASPVVAAIPELWLRRAVMGICMGLTAISIIYSPWGKQSGAHFNPAVTLTFLRLGRVSQWDSIFYMVAQFTGGVIGVAFAARALHLPLANPQVNYVVTIPGPKGSFIALVAEITISFLLMTLVLNLTNKSRLAPYTGLFGGALVSLYVALESPISGMSMNPARTTGSAFSAHLWTALWVYFLAPPAGMLLAANLFSAMHRKAHGCAKWHHQNSKRCIFCDFRGRASDAN